MTVYASLSSLLTTARASTKSVWRDGVLTTISADTLPYEDKPLVDVPPGYAYNRGILVEESRINICTRSEDFSHSGWSKTNVTVSADTTTAPDGTTTADSVIEDTSTGRHAIGRANFACTADTNKAWSIYLKPLPGSATRYPVVYITSGAVAGADRVGVVFNLSSVTYAAGAVNTSVAAPAFVRAGIEALPNGWFRLWIVGSIGGGDSTLGFYLGFSTSSASASIGNSYTGDGASGFYSRGGQIEDSADMPSSYIAATAGTTASRSADNITLATSSMPWDAAAGGLIVRGRSGIAAVGDQTIACIDGGSTANRHLLYRLSNSQVRYVVRSGGAQTSTITLGTLADSTDFAAAISWAANDYAGSLNGAAVVTSSSGAVPVSPTTLRLGYNTAGQFLNGHISRLAHRKERPDNSILPRLSALT